MSGLSKSSGGGLGGTPNKFGESKVASYPDGFAEGSLGWGNLSRVVINPLAVGWFDQYPTAPISQALRPGALNYNQPFIEQFADFYFGDNEVSVIKDLYVDLADLGEDVNIEESQLGRALIETLKTAGVTWRYETRVGINPFEAIELPDLKLEGLAQWGSYFGMPVLQRFRIYKDASGKERCVWFSPMLAATRAFEHITEREYVDDQGNVQLAKIDQSDLAQGALTFGEWSSEIFIPILATGLFYLAETPFPSAIFGMGRGIAYPDMSEQERPRPVMFHERRHDIVGVFDESGGQFQTTATMLPNVISMGWTFDSKDPAVIQKILETVTDGLNRITSFLEDGFLNYFEDGSFDATLLSASSFSKTQLGESWGDGLSRWIPAARIGLVLHNFNTHSQNAYELKASGDLDTARKWFEVVALDGAGMFLPNCINSLVFGWLIPEERWDLVDRLLDAAWRLNYGRESFNALSNWGIAKYRQGLIDEAIEKFEAALADSEGNTEAEVCHYLAKIHTERGEGAKAAEYEKRCAEAGGYTSEPGRMRFSTPSSTGLTKSSGKGLGDSSPAATLAKFCSDCGHKFESDSARFCTECGTAR